MNKTDKERLLKIMEQVEKYIDIIEEIQNKEAAKLYEMSEEVKQSESGRTLNNNCWLIQKTHDCLADAYTPYKAIEDLIDPSSENFDIACKMASLYKSQVSSKE